MPPVTLGRVPERASVTREREPERVLSAAAMLPLFRYAIAIACSSVSGPGGSEESGAGAVAGGGVAGVAVGGVAGAGAAGVGAGSTGAAATDRPPAAETREKAMSQTGPIRRVLI